MAVGTQMLIPSRLRVGYQKRRGTFTGKLAYIIYYDAKGKIRKEPSFQKWRDNSIPVDEIENVPTEGFVLNKSIQRVAEYFGSGRNMIRIYDPRGHEFEIDTANLLYILMHTDCLKRGLQGKFVYAYHGKDLVLLPEGSPEYVLCTQYTELQHKKVSTSDLIEGAVYETKQEEQFVYLGRFPYFSETTSEPYRKAKKQRIDVSKKHVFIRLNGKKFSWGKTYHVPNAMSGFARCLSETPVDNYAQLIDDFKNSDFTTRVDSFELRPLDNELIREADRRNTTGSGVSCLVRVDGKLIKGSLHQRAEDSYFVKYGPDRYSEGRVLFDVKKRSYTKITEPKYSYRYYDYNRMYTDKLVDELKHLNVDTKELLTSNVVCQLVGVMNNGTTIKFD